MIDEKDDEDIEKLDLDEEQQEQLDKIKQDCMKAFQQRQQRFTELDDMTYDEFYISNAKAANGYIPPKINQQDVRTVSGTTREKANSLVSALLNYNLEPDIEAFNPEEQPVQELGTIMEDMIRKSRLLEKPVYDVKRPLIYGEFVQQGTVFVREAFVEYSVLRKKIDNMDVADLTKMKWKESREKISSYCNSELLCGLNVYLGNIREFFIELQPYIVLRRELTRPEAKSIYGDWARWKNVPKTLTKSAPTTAGTLTATYNNWTMVEVANKMVEELLYFNVWTNSYQIILNGVPMLPVDFPLEFLTGECEYPIAKGDFEPISRFFAYSRSVPSKTKVNQALMDEMLKAIVLAQRKYNTPSIANNTGMTLSRKIFWPAQITDNVDPTKLMPIGNNDGVTKSQLDSIDLIKQLIDEGSVNTLFQGQQPQGNPTAREVVEMKQQQLMKLGLAILGVINLETKMSWLRLYNILRNWTQPVDTAVAEVKGKLKKTSQYMTSTIDSEFEDGESGKRIIQMTGGELPHPDQVQAEATLLSARAGSTIRKVYLNAEDLRNIKYKWNINIVPTEKDTSDLRAAIFMDNITRAMQLFGPQSLNLDYVKRRFANTNHENYEKLFAQPQQQGLNAMPQSPQDMAALGGAQPGQAAPNFQAQQPQSSGLQAQMKPQQMAKPSLNTVAQGA